MENYNIIGEVELSFDLVSIHNLVKKTQRILEGNAVTSHNRESHITLKSIQP